MSADIEYQFQHNCDYLQRFARGLVPTTNHSRVDILYNSMTCRAILLKWISGLTAQPRVKWVVTVPPPNTAPYFVPLAR